MKNKFVIIIDPKGYHYLSLNKEQTFKYFSFSFNKKWYVSLSEKYLFSDGTKVKLLENKEYEIIDGETYMHSKMFVYENDIGFNNYGLYENSQLIVSKSRQSQIVSKDKYIDDEIVIENGELKKFSKYTLINNKACQYQLKLENGDMVECLGHIIYYYDEFYYINNFLCDIKLNKKDIKTQVVKYHNYPRVFRQSLVYENRNELLIEDMVPFSFEYKSSVMSFNQMIPGIVMSLSMSAIAFINVYNSLLEGKSILSILPIVLMPLALICTSLLLPIINKIIDKSKKKKAYKKYYKEYLDYLDKYTKELNKTIDAYLSNEYLYCINHIGDRLFFLNNNSNYFATLSLGTTKIKDTQSLPKYKEKDLSQKMDIIRKLFEKEKPLYLQVLNYKAISIYDLEPFIDYRFKTMVYELAIKNNFNQLKIAIFSKNVIISSYLAFLPHEFMDQKRLVYTNEYQIRQLDTSIDIPIVLIALDSLDYVFKNKNIHVVYLSSDRSSTYVGSELIIDYYHKNGCIFDGEKKYFNCLNTSINYDDSFYIMSQYNTYSVENKTKTFRDFFYDGNIKNNYLCKQEGLVASFAYKDDNLFSLDLHESKNGPHGLIGGTTGSGKSELIISFLLSLCIRYSPEYLNIILIDYKGGGINESLSYKGRSLPHVVAALNNIDESSFERLIIAISKECERRQGLFNQLSRISGSNVSNIDDYLKEYDEKYGLERIAHLLIVVDEFAELKKNQSIFMKELVSFSRIGRSLGIHLVLATQKPNGNIDEEIWSNSRFKIALKVADEKDSQDIIKTKEAYRISKPGEFYLLVDGTLEKANALYSKNDYEHKDDYEIDILDSCFSVKKQKIKDNTRLMTEAQYYVKRINEICDEKNITIGKWDFGRHQSYNEKELRRIYKYDGEDTILGEIDDYKRNKRGLLVSKKYESSFIVSQRKDELINFINTYKNDELVVISNKRITKIPDSLKYDDEEDIKYFFRNIHKKKKTVLIIDDINCLLSYDDAYLDMIYKLARKRNSLNLTIVLLSRTSQVPFKLINCFQNKYCIEVFEKEEVSALFSYRGDLVGDSFYYDNGLIPFVPIKLTNKVIHNSNEKAIDEIPEEIRKEKERVLIGYDCETRKKVYLENELNIVYINKKQYLSFSKYYEYKEVNIYEYNDSLLHKNFDKILWIGEGVHAQRLFYPQGIKGIEEDEGVYMSNGKVIKVKLVNHE